MTIVPFAGLILDVMTDSQGLGVQATSFMTIVVDTRGSDIVSILTHVIAISVIIAMTVTMTTVILKAQLLPMLRCLHRLP